MCYPGLYGRTNRLPTSSRCTPLCVLIVRCSAAVSRSVCATGTGPTLAQHPGPHPKGTSLSRRDTGRAQGPTAATMTTSE